PVYDFILRRTKRPELSSSITIGIALLLMILPAVYVVTELVHQVSGAATTFPVEKFGRIADYVKDISGGRIILKDLLSAGVDQLRDSVLGMAPNILGSITELVLGLFIMFFVMFYGFREGHEFLEYVKQLLPLDSGLKDSLFYELQTITQAVLY